MCQWKSRNVHGVGLGLCPLCRREGVLVRMIISRVKGRKKRQVFRYILMHLDTNTRSAKGGRSTATTMMLILIRAGENRACLHRISVLVSGRRYPPMASLRLLSLRNRRPQRSISFTFTLLVVGRGNNTGWRARRVRKTRSGLPPAKPTRASMRPPGDVARCSLQQKEGGRKYTKGRGFIVIMSRRGTL